MPQARRVLTTRQANNLPQKNAGGPKKRGSNKRGATDDIKPSGKRGALSEITNAVSLCFSHTLISFSFSSDYRVYFESSILVDN